MRQKEIFNRIIKTLKRFFIILLADSLKKETKTNPEKKTWAKWWKELFHKQTIEERFDNWYENMARQKNGMETIDRLSKWGKGQAASERLSGVVLQSQGYEKINPSHPIGGKDGKKDFICYKNNKKYIVGCHFTNGQKKFSETQKKFREDVGGVALNQAKGFVFITNQELKLSERNILEKLVDDEIEVEIFHLEFIALVLNNPINYGVRLDFLDIEMTKEEIVSHNAAKDQLILGQQNQLSQYNNTQNQTNVVSVTVIPESYEVLKIGDKALQPVHKCSNCGYGYKTKGYGLSQYDNNMKYFTYTGTTENVVAGNIFTTTCPKCGNTDFI